MIEVAKDATAESTSADTVTSRVTPDVVRTEEVVEHHDNFEVHNNVAPSPYAETAIEALSPGEPNMNLDTPSSAAVPEDTSLATPVYGQSPFETSPAVPVTETPVLTIPPAGTPLEANTTAAANPIEASLIGAHDAHAVIDPVSATQYAPQEPYSLNPKFAAGLAAEADNINRVFEAGMQPRDDLGALNPPGADGFQTFAPTGNETSEGASVANTDSTGAMASAFFGTPGTDKAVEAVFGAADATVDPTAPLSSTGDMKALELVYGEDRLPGASAPITSTGPAAVDTDSQGAGDTAYVLGAEPKPKTIAEKFRDLAPEPAPSKFTAVESLDLSQVPEVERIVTDKGVDLTRLTRFNEERSATAPRTKKPKAPRPEGQTPQQQQGKKPQGQGKQPAKQGKQQAPVAPPPLPVINRNSKSQNYLREAMGDRFEGVDGEDHINTSSMGVTGMGRDLDINAKTPFHHPDLGPFASVGGLWYFVGAEIDEANPKANDKFRYLFGKACRVEGQNVAMRDVRGFRTIIAEATWIKVRSIEKLSAHMAENNRPYRSYYTVGERFLRKSTPIAEWYMPVLEEIGRTLKLIYNEGQADAVPNFDFLDQPAEDDAPTRNGRHEQRNQRQNRAR